MNNEVKTELINILGILIRIFSMFLAPLAIIAGLFIGGLVGWCIAGAALVFPPVGYVLHSLKNFPVSCSEAIQEVIFWYLAGWLLVLTCVSLISFSIIAIIATALVTAVTVVYWKVTSKLIRTRIKRAPII
ncbi:hypothetical protein ACFOND_13805 [Reinekea marina]|uniref:Uncharacterized protein n=1 Tax=Reinekea marina TaxID=1310421 RepID=A0ABV7WUR4_9GAMM